MEPVYKRLLLKLSGEVLAGEAGHGFDFNIINEVCNAVKKVTDKGVQVGIVVGGGNFWRGRSSGDMDRTRADSIGMLATVMNSLALQQGFLDVGVDAQRNRFVFVDFRLINIHMHDAGSGGKTVGIADYPAPKSQLL